MCSGGSCALNAGRRHAMEMRFVQRGGEQRLEVGGGVVCLRQGMR
jgi:hypothetical protein